MATASLTKYACVYKNEYGKLTKNTFQASSVEAIVRDFSARGYTLLEAAEISTSGLNMEIKFGGKKRVKPKDMATFARKFSAMIDAGVPIKTILSTLGRSEGQNPTLKEVIKDLERRINSGTSLSAAMAKHPTVFSPLMISMVDAGQQGGFLDKSMRQVAENLEKELKLRGQIKSAMTYPVMVLILALLICTGVLLFLVPIFDDMFKNLGSKLPFATRILVSLSNIMKVAIWPIAAVIVGFIIWWRKHRFDRKVREIKDPIMLKIPIMGKLLRKIILARFFRNFATLQDNGVPILTTMDIVAGTTNSIVVERVLEEVSKKVRQGATLSEALREHEIFPQEDIEMVAIGEESGDTVSMMEKIAQMYDEEVEAQTAALTSILEPIMIVFLGALVGGMVIALYLPIFSIGSAIQGQS